MITPETFSPYGDHDEHEPAETIMFAEVDGVRWFTDRYLLIRADLVEPKPTTGHMFKMNPGAGESLGTFVETVMKAETLPAPDPKNMIAPIFVAHIEDAGLQIAPSAKVWLIKQGDVTVGAVAPTRQRGDSFPGILPGQIQPAHRAVEEILSSEIDNGWYRWNTAFLTVEAVRANS